MKELILNKGKESSLRRGHPWIYSGAVCTPLEGFSDGALVRVLSAQKEFLAIAYVQQGQGIAAKVLSFTDRLPDQDFWNQHIKQAFASRQSLGLCSAENNIFRLVNGEGDYLPGLIIDYYHGTLVVQYHHPFYLQMEQALVSALLSCKDMQVKNIYRKSQATLWRKSKIDSDDQWLKKEDERDAVIAWENAIRYKISPETAQKTGFFIDQRDNRKLVRNYAQNKTVLNTFSYTGGFSLSALAGGAALVVSVDSSVRAMQELEENLLLNALGGSVHESVTADIFDFIKEDQRLFDIVILDPPAFAKNKGALQNALKSYKRLNIAGIKKVEKGGLLFSFSCSQVVDIKLFEGVITSSVIESGRRCKVLHRLEAGADHPCLLIHPEGKYLKGLVLQLD